MKFRLGQKVICVHAPAVPLQSPWVAFPKQWQFYTIRGYRPDEIPSVLLHEIVSEIGGDGLEAGFFEERFRAVDTHETDISCLKALLNQTPEPVQ
jgi:hypothetical protein